MASASDVAAAVLSHFKHPISAMKLQKLVYYCQAWHLVWQGRPLFVERIEAWANGPVVPELYRRHRGRYELDVWPDGDAARLGADERGTVQAVVAVYGDLSAKRLSELTHSERPWRDARVGVPDGARSNTEITSGALLRFYSRER